MWPATVAAIFAVSVQIALGAGHQIGRHAEAAAGDLPQQRRSTIAASRPAAQMSARQPRSQRFAATRPGRLRSAEDELADAAGCISGIHGGPPCRSCAGAAASTSMISATRPGRGDITTTRSASSTASGIEWVTNRMVFGCSLPDAQQLDASAPRASAHRARRTARPSAECPGRGPARGRSPRAAACRRTARADTCPRSPRGRPASAASRALVACRPRRSLPIMSQREQHVVEHARPGQQGRRLEHDAGVRRAARVTGVAVDRDAAGGRAGAARRRAAARSTCRSRTARRGRRTRCAATSSDTSASAATSIAAAGDEDLGDTVEDDHAIAAAPQEARHRAARHLSATSDVSNAWFGSQFIVSSCASAIASQVVFRRSGDILARAELLLVVVEHEGHDGLHAAHAVVELRPPGTFCDMQLAGLLRDCRAPIRTSAVTARRKRFVSSGFLAIVLSVAMIEAA